MYRSNPLNERSLCDQAHRHRRFSCDAGPQSRGDRDRQRTVHDPSQQPTIDAFYQSQLAQIGSGPRVDAGIRVGERAANAILAARANDGANLTPPVFVPLAGPGEYQLTPPAFAPAGFTQTAHVTPFVLDSASQFRPGPPPALTSPRTRPTSMRSTRWVS
jgi:hypothetical protein